MKKVFLTTIIILAIILSSSAFGFSQYDNNQREETLDNFTEYVSLNSSAEIPSNDVNIKAAKDFERQFKNVSNAKWYKTPEAFVADFTENEIETKVIYDLKGNWHCMLRTYGEQKLPFDVRDQVKSKYYDFEIMVVYEITHSDNVSYILKIEDSKKIKTLRVSNGEMEVIGDYERG